MPIDNPSTVLASRLDPGTITVLKGNKPLCLRIQRQHRLLYASEAAFINFAVDNEKGCRELEEPPMTMLTIRHEDVRAIENSEFRFIPQECKGTLPEGVNALTLETPRNRPTKRPTSFMMTTKFLSILVPHR